MIEMLLPTKNSSTTISSATMMLHMDGTIGSTSLVDSANNFTFSRSGGSGSILNGGKFNQYMNFPANTYFIASYHSLMNLTTQDFTIEAWLYPTNSASNPIFSRTIMGSGGYSYSFMLNLGRLDFYWTPNGSHGSNIRITAMAAVTLNAWSHVAVSRVGSTVRIFQNGVMVSSSSIGTIYSTSQPLYIGGDPSGYYYNGAMDEMRFINGVGLYTTNFAVPTAPFS